MKKLKYPFLSGLSCIAVIAALCAFDANTTKQDTVEQPAHHAHIADAKRTTVPSMPLFYGKGSLSGHYLAGRFAQGNRDWQNATHFLKQSLRYDPDNVQLQKMALIAASSSGNTKTALNIARSLVFEHNISEPASLILASDYIKQGDYIAAQRLLEKSENRGLTDFVIPLIKAWSDQALAKKGDQNGKHVKEFIESVMTQPTNPVHIMHAAMLAESIGQHDSAKTLYEQLFSLNQTRRSLEAIADFYARTGDAKQAEMLYHALLRNDTGDRVLLKKLSELKTGNLDRHVKNPRWRNDPKAGIAYALYDTAALLSYQGGDDSALLFSRLATLVDPALHEANILAGDILTRYEQYDDALASYQSVPSNSPHNQEALLRIARTQEASGQHDDAVSTFHTLLKAGPNIEAFIQMGDMHRRNNAYDKALNAYDKAFGELDKLTEDYWFLLYARGIAHERTGNWDEAEADFQKALSFEPNNPYILNYLGYSWADQGLYLEEALGMIQKAVKLKPNDGHIVDSLGWTLYRMGRYDEAHSVLERAVELMPYDYILNDHLGDALWKTGRKKEARFQWQRAIHYADDSADQSILNKIREKLQTGLADNRQHKPNTQQANAKDHQ